MTVYGGLVVVVVLAALLFRGDKNRTTFLRVAFFALFFLMAFRHALKIGVDSATSYYQNFLYIQVDKFVFDWGKNPGLLVIMKIIHIFTHEYQWLIIISAVWICLAYYKLLSKYSENTFISIMWFLGMLFYTFTFSALKQAWAMSFLCYAFTAIIDKKKWRFLLLVGLAALFHFPALVFLPAYWIAQLKINGTFPVLMLAILGVVFVFRSQILNLMISAYNNGDSDIYTADGQLISVKFLYMLLILAYGFYHYFTYHPDNRLYGMLLYFMGIATAIQVFCIYNNVFERLADYYFQFSILFMPLMIMDTIAHSDKKKSTDKYNIEDQSVLVAQNNQSLVSSSISLGTVLAVGITIFCIIRFLSVTGSEGSLSPFYFFWQ